MENLKPGRELDALIAEKIFGLGRHSLNVSNQKQYEEVRQINIDEIRFCPEYSTDIAAAWPIVEMFKERGDYKIEISAYPKDSCWTIKAYGKKSCTTSAKTLPHAICLAALKAIEK